MTIGRALSVLLLAAVAAAAPRASAPLFREVAEETGLRFTHVNGATGEFYMPEIMGAGGALVDFDHDGDLDVFLVQGGALTGEGAAAPRHQLFRNDLTGGSKTGPLRFTDVTAAAGLAPAATSGAPRAYGMGVAVGDYDNDGHVDLYVTSFGPNTLYRNRGDGTFADVTARAGDGLDDPRWSTSATFVDYDRDGDLDLFVAAYIDFTIAGNKICRDASGARTYCTPTAYRPLPDRLFRNNGDGTFTDVTSAAGIDRAFGNALGVAAFDADADGWLDLYVANDAMANQLWINQRDGTFVDRGVLSGTAFNAEGLPEGSMGIAVGDLDNDRDDDLYVTHLPRETNTLYVNHGSGAFEDATVPARLAVPSMPFTGFGTGFFDFDHDGLLDLFVANGAVTNIEAQRGQPAPFKERNQLYRNAGRGRFVEISTSEAGPALAFEEISRGAAFGDIDNDGDVDILVTNNGGPARLLINDAGAPRAWLSLQLDTRDGRRQALGARVALAQDGSPLVWRRAHTDGSYLSANDSRVHFGLDGTVRAGNGLLVEWPDGTREGFAAVRPNTSTRLRQGTGRAQP